MNSAKDILLTVVIPTYNRADLLRHTLSLMEEQLRRNSSDVQLVICDNVCTDNTKDVVDDVRRSSGIDIQYIKYTEHVSIGKSITRSIENVNSKYFIVWGDDDIPSPMMLDVIIATLKKYPEVGTLSFNRINAFADTVSSVSLNSLYVFKPRFNQYIHYYELSQDYAEDHFSEMGFISINVVSTDSWNKGKEVYSDSHFGYEFIAPILYGTMGQPCIYIEYPLCVKRNPPAEGFSYAKYWPLYTYIGKPRILKDLESLGVIRNARDVFHNDMYNNRDEYIKNLFYFCYPNQEVYTQYVDEMVSYQTDKVRIFMTKAIKLPKWRMQIVRRLYRVAKKFRLI